MATMDAAGRRKRAQTDYDAFLRDCPTHQLLTRISDKWAVLVLGALVDGPLRYNELGRRIEGVSPKMLTQTLRSLERDGLVSRTVTLSVPVRVDYELTALGASLGVPLTAVREWAEAHMDEVHKARLTYDVAAS
ncbi:helix-turn-helix domain-containing protein [Streptomyces sp. NPDC007162]|uniref:winged helix-turn-helix transcriptional regulator n=1 Tax=Streptomyces sp. NPDC007162 TaxID=3156917 RepID=UPI0033DBCE49